MCSDAISGIRRTMILWTLLGAAFLAAMSTTVTGTMLPNFTEAFGISSNLAQWLTGGAALIAGSIMPVTAFLIKRIPDKIYFLSAVTAFAAGSLTAVLSGSFTMLLASRMLQAVGCGMLLPFIQIVLLKLYPKERHGAIMAAYAMASMVSAVVGPTYAGLVLDAFGWRGVFGSLMAGGILILVCGMVFLKNVTEQETAKLHGWHAVLSSVGFAAFLIGVSNLEGGIFSLKSGGTILAGLLLLAVFTILQWKSDDPMLNLRIFRHPPFRIAVLLNLCLYLISMGNAVILPVFTKSLRGFSDTAYGLATLIGSVLAVVTALFAGKHYDRAGVRPLLLGGTGLFAVFSFMGCFLSRNASIPYIAVVFALQSVALSALNSPTTAMALSGLEGKERIDGSAIYNTLRQIASSLGSTLSVLIFTLAGSNFTAVRVVFGYFGAITAGIAAAVFPLAAGRKFGAAEH